MSRLVVLLHSPQPAGLLSHSPLPTRAWQMSKGWFRPTASRQEKRRLSHSSVNIQANFASLNVVN